MTRRRLRSAFSALVVAVLATTQFAFPLCGMQGEAAGGAEHHAEVAALQPGEGGSHPHHTEAAHTHDPVVLHQHGAERTGQVEPAAEVASTSHDAAHHEGGHSGTPGCLDMTVCVAPALGARPTTELQTRSSHTLLIPSLADAATSIAPSTLRRPPKSL